MNNGEYQFNTAPTEEIKTEEKPAVSPKSQLIAGLLCWFLGLYGVHRFYVGKIGSGIVYFLTGGGLFFGALIDFIKICSGTFTDKDGLPLKK